MTAPLFFCAGEMATAAPEVPRIQAAFGDRLLIHGPIRLGGQALVLHASRDVTGSPGLRQDLALKVYLDRAQDERVEREIQVAMSVRHFALANLLEHGTVDIDGSRFKYLVWELIPGEALDSKIGRDGPLPPRIACLVGRDVATAVEAIWSRRIVHRDVNPKNIMLRSSQEGAVLIDLGIAKYLDQTPLTAPGIAWGTAGYLSPEQMMGMDLTCQSDVFSLGVTLQQALCGRHPTNGDQRPLAAGGVRTADLAPAVPARLAHVLDLMVKQRAAHRPSPKALVEEFVRLIGIF